MLAKLHRLLRECYFKKSDEILKVLLNADETYLIQRAAEELAYSRTESNPVLKDAKRKLAIQLINLSRFKASGESLETPKRLRGRIPSKQPLQWPR